MPALRLVCAVVISLVAYAAGTAASPQERPAVDDVLARAGEYLSKYEEGFSGIVSREAYRQSQFRGSLMVATRALKSDLLVINLGDGLWAGFRDVFDVDGKAVRDHEDRILALFTKPGATTLDQAKRILAEGARFNLGNIERTLNTPTVALGFLRAANQSRSEFKLDSVKTQDGVRVAVLRFLERAEPRMIVSRDNAPASGRFWIEQDTGRVRQSELLFDSANAQAKITVGYAARPSLDLWVPVSMDEEYILEASRNLSPLARSDMPKETIIGHATYDQFLQAKVDVSAIIKKDGGR
jgi:hypothetical protein